MVNVVTAYRRLDESQHRAAFYRMWHAAHSASLTHPAALTAMGHVASPGVEEARRWLLAGTTRGRGVTDLVDSGGTRFDECERALLALGEESGRLEQCLKLLAEYFTRRHKLMLWVKKQLTYPVTTGLAASFIAPLPLLVKGFTAAYIASSFGAALALSLAAGGALLGVAYGYAGRPAMARARFARGLATAVEAGLPLDRALRLGAAVSGNAEIAAHVSPWSVRQLSGQSVGATLAGCPHLTPDFLATIDTAERTGDYSVLTRLAELYEDGFK